MRSSLKLALALSAVISSPLFAASTLIIPEDVKLLAVNMEKPKPKGGLFSDTKTLEIPDGINQIVFKYQPEFEIGDDIKTTYSDVVIARFDVSNEKLTFELPEFKTYRQAQLNISPLVWQLLDRKGEPIALVEDTLESDGVQIGRNFPQEARNYNIAGGIASVAVTYVTLNQHQQPVASANQTEEPVRSVSESSQADSPMVDLLKTMYKKAGPEERAAFKAWVMQQQ
jgi:uncharacterized protein YccT (UPF0319 family)